MIRLVGAVVAAAAVFGGAALAQGGAKAPAQGAQASRASRASQASQASKEEHVRGDVVAVQGDALEVRTRDGQQVRLRLAPDLRVTQAAKADAGAIAKGGFVGTTAVPQPDGTLRAVEVHVFPEAMRGSGEGHRPWDLEAGSTMTNATVAGTDAGAAASGTGSSSMTNATVEEIGKGEGGQRLTLRYAGGEKTVVVPPGTPVVRIEPGDRSQLKPGAHVFVGVTRERAGRAVARRVIVGKDGAVPPM